MAAWARPRLLVVVDFDQVVIDLHQSYRAAFLACETPRQFVSFWAPGRAARRAALEAINDILPQGPERYRIKQVFVEYRDNVKWGLRKVRERAAQFDFTTFMDDPEQYAVLRRIFLEERYLFVRGDFTGTKTLADLSRAATEVGLPVRVLYLSNVEQYFSWGSGHFRDNMLGLPVDERSVVLRAYGFGRHRTADGNYRYYVQAARQFQQWLRHQPVKSVKRLLEEEQATDIEGFYRLVDGPPRPAGTARVDPGDDQEAAPDDARGDGPQRDARRDDAPASGPRPAISSGEG
jgi:hypothetical protein